MAWLIRREGVPPVLVEGEITVGRASYSTIWLDDTAVSRTHCRFTAKKGQLVLRDESSNGTFVNGVRSGRIAHLNHGDIIQVASHTLTVQETPAPTDKRRAPSDPALVMEDERTAVTGARPGGSQQQPQQHQHHQQHQHQQQQHQHQNLPLTVPPPPQQYQQPAARMPKAEALFATGEAPIAAPVPTTVIPMARPLTGENAVAVGAVGFASGVVESSFQVQVVEDVTPGAPPIRYRDAVRLVDGSALAVMTDIVGGTPLSAEMVKRWKTAVRGAGARALGPDAVLQVLNLELFAANLKATALCARLEAKDSLLAVSCAGTPPPWIIRCSRRVVRVQATASVGLGAVKSAQWAARTLHFERGDTLVLASAGWSTPLEETLEGNLPDMARIPEWLRGHPAKPPDGSAIVLTMT